MSVNTTLAGLSQTASSNGPDGTVDPPSTIDDAQRYLGSFIATLRDGKGFTGPVTLASASTTDIGAQNAFAVEISGTTTITSFGTSYNGPRFLRFTGALVLTHNATTLNLPGAANITTVAGDTCIAYPNLAANGWNVVSYQTVTSAQAPRATRIDVASVAGTVDLTANAPNTDDIRITGALAITGFTVAVGRVIRVTAGGAFTLANNANIVTQSGATLAFAANDTFTLRATAANVVEVLSLARGTTSGTKVALTSGTTADSSAVPAWATKITAPIVGFSGNGSSLPIAQFLVAGSPVATGYTGGTFVATPTPQVGTQAASTGIPLAASGTAAAIYHGELEMNRADSSTFTWTWSLKMWRTDGGGVIPHFGAGSVVLTGVPSAIRLTFTNGTDAFDGAAGAFFNINYYG